MKNWKIGTRLVGGFALVLALAVLMTGLGLWRLNVVADATAQMADVPLSKERMISDWYRFVYSGVRRTTAVVKSSDPSLGAFFAVDAAASTKDSADLQKKIEPLLTTSREKELWQEIMRRRKDYLSTRDASTKAKGDGNSEEATRIFENQYIPASNKYMDVIQQLLEMQRDSINTTAVDIQSIYIASRNLLTILCVFVLAIGGVASLWLTRSITHPLGRAVEAARSVASGNLTSDIQVTSKDETGQLLKALKDMNGELARMISEVRGGIDTIATASSQIAAGNQDLSARTEEQASSLEETASSMEELTSTVKQNADNAKQANQLAVTASGVAEKGGEVVSQVVNTMGSINESSRKIVDIISVIDGIAFQTNILALNAAVEAARAGEQGRGFAVVAAEVRTLAQRSANAAKEIKSLINDSVEKVEVGSKLVNQAGATMEEVVDSVKRVTDIMAEIMAASQEQSAGIEQVNQAITQMDQVTQQNAALVEESAAAADAMQQQASTLSQAVAVFRIDSNQAAVSIKTAPSKSVTASVRGFPKTVKVPLPTPVRQRIATPAKTSGDDWEEF